MTIFSTNKLNLRLIRASSYIQRFNLNIRHKSKKQHVVSNILSRLTSLNIFFKTNEKKLNVFFIINFVKMNEFFRNRLLKSYNNDFAWKKIFNFLEIQENVENNAFFFYRQNELIFCFDDCTIDEHAFESRRLCISQSLIVEIFNIIYEIVNEYSKFDKYYKRISLFYFIKKLTQQLRNYFYHCSNCQINQTKKHRFYELMQFILTSSIFFYTFIIDFILTLSKSHVQLNFAMSIICKFFKRITCILDKTIWFVAQ